MIICLDTDDYDIDYYVDQITAVAARKLALYGQLRDRLAEFKSSLRDEEEEHLRFTVAKLGKGFKGPGLPFTGAGGGKKLQH